MRFLIGILLIACGAAIIRYRYAVYNFTGEWGWAERYLGSSGTVNAIVFIGMGFVFFGAAYALWAINLSPVEKPIITEIQK